MITVGASENLKGTPLLRRAVELWRPGMMVTKELYPALAREVSSTASRVERSMRHAIEKAFTRSGWCDDVMALFGNAIDPDKGKPTVTEFVARVAYLCHAD